MKNVTSIKSDSINESPKTPGGISKTLLTPCRRIGLPRKWKNKGPSPFVSPISSSNKIKVETPTKKKKCEIEEECSKIQTGALNNIDRNIENKEVIANVDKFHTPSRSEDLPRKRSKILECITEGNDNIAEENNISKEIANNLCGIGKSKGLKLTKTKSNKKIKNTSPVKINSSNIEYSKDKSTDTVNDLVQIAEKSPNNLTKECIVVIQKNIFNNERTQDVKNYVSEQTTDNQSHVINDSDSDDIPLNKLNNIENIQLSKEEVNKVILGEDDDFIIKKSHDHKEILKNSPQYKKQKVVKSKIINNKKSKVPIKLNVELVDDDDDDDFEMDNKRTILIKKTYEKVTKPQKAKSTGSITQKDIDELRARIEEKKKLLLAKTLTNDTQELRDLIKKWQRGCQDALMQLMDLMKEKCDKKMEYTDILQMLNIPSSLVGYDSDNEYFVTPDDASIVLAKYNE